MNVQDNSIYDLDKFTQNEIADLLETKPIIEVPKQLERAADHVLKGKKKAKVSFVSGGKLSKWAAKKRKELRISRNFQRGYQ